MGFYAHRHFAEPVSLFHKGNASYDLYKPIQQSKQAIFCMHSKRL
ncbi:hypothetical protein [Caudoviricetes sp.]|nr:hypothetical protein [Caudoviricetes sp.]